MIYSLRNPIRHAVFAALALLVVACSDAGDDLLPIDRARAALAAGDGVKAEVILRDMIAAGTDRSEVAAFLGEAELQQGQLAEAREWLRGGDFSEETQTHGFHMLARLEMVEGNLPAAGQAFDKALARNRENSDLWVDIARLRYRGGEQLQAVEASDYAVELEPDNPRASQLRGQLTRDSQGMFAAIPWFERALENAPDDPDILYDYAATLGELGRANDMLRIVRHIAEVDPANRRIYFLQAVLAARAENYELARSLLLRTSKATQEEPAAMLLSGVIDIENGNYASAAQTLEILSAKQPDNRRVRNLLARALSLGGNDRELVYQYEEVARRPGASPYLITLVGRSLEALDRREEAAEFLDRAVLARSGNLIAIPPAIELSVAEARGGQEGLDAVQLVRARIGNGMRGQTESAAKAYLDRFPGSADALALAGDSAFADGLFARAIRHYETAVRIRRPWPITQKLINAYRAAGRGNDSLILLARYFVGDPGNQEAAGQLAKAALNNGDIDAAATFLEHALANGGYRDPHLLALRSNVALELDDLETAFDAAQAAYDIQPMNREATQALINAYGAIGDHEDHVRVLKAKLERLPR